MQRVFDTHLMNESVARGRAHLAPKGMCTGTRCFITNSLGGLPSKFSGRILQASGDVKAAIRAFLLLCKRFEPHLDLSRSDLWPRGEADSSEPLHTARRGAT
jgi:hypothetical protein